ncbi:MAG TPA: hypothetical protein VKD69_14775 [Vicinamibacterales bacterium]|nr:hypothetical protein [Vicinamibacterales bacterium]
MRFVLARALSAAAPAESPYLHDFEAHSLRRESGGICACGVGTK